MSESRRVTISNRQRVAPIRARQVEVTLLGVLRREGCGLNLEVVFVDADEIRSVNRRFLGRTGLTDVIAFPMADSFDAPGESILGEVVVCVEKAVAEAKRRKLPLDREVLLYAVHGTLHLLGYDDHAPADVERMRAAESQALRSAGWSGR